MVCTCGKDPSHNSAERARDKYGADDDLLYVDTDLTRGVFAFADDGDLITLLTPFEVDMDSGGEKRNDEDVEQIFLTEDSGEPTVLGIGVDEAENH